MHILLAVDGSEASEVAARTVASRPWPEGSEVVVLSVVADIFPAAPEMAFAPNYDEMMHGLVRQAQMLVARIVNVLRHEKLAAHGLVKRGDARDVIVEHAAEWGADLIVVGSHGRTGLRRLMMGSVAEQVVRHATCSVEVARELAKHAPVVEPLEDDDTAVEPSGLPA